MKKLLAAAAAGFVVSAAGLAPALAQPPAPAAAPAKLSAANTPIEVIAKNPKAKAALIEVLPEIADYIDQIGAMTLTDLIPAAQGLIDDAKIKALQAKFDKL